MIILHRAIELRRREFAPPAIRDAQAFHVAANRTSNFGFRHRAGAVAAGALLDEVPQRRSFIYNHAPRMRHGRASWVAHCRGRYLIIHFAK